MDNLIFALDIGTRSVVGVVCENENNTLKVREIKSCFHKQRSMFDGQIEDIEEVSRVIGIVKKELEIALDTKLNKVCIAAAGRALKTERIVLEKDIDSRVSISKDFIKAMEIEALQLAQDIFSKGAASSELFYCVGYSVLNYKLDNKAMIKIEAHRGSKASVEIIAAFLPHTVIEGLYTCMDNNGLEVCNLTLEPIAAMDLIIPPELRLLNLALVDIGAGTSDIAISKNGSIVGYDMATIAGDEITECIMRNYLVDFNAAEEIKSNLSNNENNIEFTNVLGLTETLNKKEVIEIIKPSVYDLCSDITAKITNMNKEAPAAVFLAGGGSKTPFLIELLAEFLNIPHSRIALTDKKSLKNVDLTSISFYGPELITPLGIAYSEILNKNYDFFSVSVNDKKVRLYNIRQMKVMDALLMANFDAKKLIGISGKSLRFYINNKLHYYPGDLSIPAQIFVNSVAATIETTIHPKDKIEVVEAKNGTTQIIKISDIDEEVNSKIVYFNGLKTDTSTRYFANNKEVSKNYIIKNSDNIKIEKIETIKDLFKLYKINEKNHKCYVNKIKVELDYRLYDKMRIDVLKEEDIKENNQVAITLVDDTNNVAENKKDEKNVDKNENEFINITINDELIKLPKTNEPYIFADMLNYTAIDPTKPKGNIILLHNNEDASYSNIVNDNDFIVIKWDID